MSYSIDANLLLYASNAGCSEHSSAHRFLLSRRDDPDLFCLTWPTVFAYLRIATHPSIFRNPLSPDDAWSNVHALIRLPRVRMIGEEEGFLEHYQTVTADLVVRGNLVPDAHLAAVLLQHGVRKLYTTDTDFRKFSFLKVVNPLRDKA